MIISLLHHLYFVNPTEIGNDTIMIGVCPNPAYDKLNLLVMDKFDIIVYELCNEKNVVLEMKAFKTKEESVNLIKHKGKNFILKVYDDRKLLKSFQIQKVF
ncbi:MAG: hypothetical protein A3F72_02490 [Bacteroidetes bacterium RIFCSPLOWO2_12_FULL_35_15]|nr:MAG: hypothetical protein A3F72_02490 [Bacteroidetes bacterium RIFCSPLOWO2_12_FULL_35_15]